MALIESSLYNRLNLDWQARKFSVLASADLVNLLKPSPKQVFDDVVSHFRQSAYPVPGLTPHLYRWRFKENSPRSVRAIESIAEKGIGIMAESMQIAEMTRHDFPKRPRKSRKTPVAENVEISAPASRSSKDRRNKGGSSIFSIMEASIKRLESSDCDSDERSTNQLGTWQYYKGEGANSGKNYLAAASGLRAAGQALTEPGRVKSKLSVPASLQLQAVEVLRMLAAHAAVDHCESA